MKAFIYMNDVAADQGPASVVRGSHRISQLGVTPAGLFDFASGGFRAHREHADQKEAAQAPFTGRGAGDELERFAAGRGGRGRRPRGRRGPRGSGGV